MFILPIDKGLNKCYTIIIKQEDTTDAGRREAHGPERKSAMFQKEITVNSIIEGAARNLVSDLRAWNKYTRDANDTCAAALNEKICAKVWMLDDIGLRAHIETNQRGYAAKVTINGAEFEVITDCFADSDYR